MALAAGDSALGRVAAAPAGAPRLLAYTSGDGVPGSREIRLIDVDTGEVESLTRHPPAFASAAWSSDGRSLLLSSNEADAGGGGLFVSGVNGTGLRRVSPLFEDAVVAPSPRAGGLLAIARGRGGLWVARADGTRARRLARTGWEPMRWSPDGTRIAFVTTHSRALLVVSVATGRSTDAARWSGPDAGFEELAWSPDGRRLVGTYCDWRRGDYECWLRVGSARRGFPELPVAGWAPAWSPDGRRIAIATGKAVRVLRPDGSGVRTLARVPWLTGPIAWSRDGRSLAVVGGRPAAVLVIDAVRGGVRKMRRGERLPLAARLRPPAWHPDGSRAVFVQQNEDDAIVRVVSGTARPRVVFASASDSDFAWSPDGARAAFRRTHGKQLSIVVIEEGRERVVARSEGGNGETSTQYRDEAYEIAWTRTSDAIAFVRRGAIYVVGADGTRAARIAVGSNPRWHPSGDLAFTRGGGIWVTRVGGSPRALITRMPCQGQTSTDVLDLRWSPDGSLLAFTVRSDESSCTFVVRRDGTGLRLLAEDLLGELEWSPRGDRIAGGVYHVVQVDLAGTVLGGWGQALDPAWSPDGEWLAYSKDSGEGRSAQRSVYVRRADGSAEQRLTRGGLDLEPEWRPNG